MKTLFFVFILALGLLAHETATAQTVASCPTATPGSTWNPTTQWLKCSDLTYIAEPIPATALINDMRCNHVSDTCVFSWMLPAKVLPTDQTWVKTTAKPNGTWVASSTLSLLSAAAPTINCTTLVYIGQPLTVTSQLIQPGQGAPPHLPPLTGIVMQSETTIPLAFDFSYTYDELIYANGEGQPGNAPYNFANEPVNFTLTPNSAGTAISTWNVSYEWSPQNPNNFSVVSTQAGDTVTWNYEYGNTVVYSNTTPGTWECLDTLFTQLSTAQSQSSTLATQLARANAQITTLQGQLTAANAQIASLQAQVTSRQTQLAAASKPAATTPASVKVQSKEQVVAQR